MKTFTRSLLVGALCTAALMFLPPADQRPQAGALPLIPQHLLKLDGLLRSDVASHKSGTRRVLIRSKSSDRLALKQQLESQGYSVISQLDGETLTVVVPAQGLEAVAKWTRVLGVSSDAIVVPHGQLLGGVVGGLVGGVTGILQNTVKGLLGTVGYLLDPSLDEGANPFRQPCCAQRLDWKTRGRAKAWSWRSSTPVSKCRQSSRGA